MSFGYFLHNYNYSSFYYMHAYIKYRLSPEPSSSLSMCASSGDSSWSNMPLVSNLIHWFKKYGSFDDEKTVFSIRIFISYEHLLNEPSI